MHDHQPIYERETVVSSYDYNWLEISIIISTTYTLRHGHLVENIRATNLLDDDEETIPKVFIMLSIEVKPTKVQENIECTQTDKLAIKSSPRDLRTLHPTRT